MKKRIKGSFSGLGYPHREHRSKKGRKNTRPTMVSAFRNYKRKKEEAKYESSYNEIHK